jgi:hypothetical protein
MYQAKKLHDNLLDNMNFFYEILYENDFPEDIAAKVMLKLKQVDFLGKYKVEK